MKFYEHGSKLNLSQDIVKLFWHLCEKIKKIVRMPGNRGLIWKFSFYNIKMKFMQYSKTFDWQSLLVLLLKSIQYEMLTKILASQKPEWTWCCSCWCRPFSDWADEQTSSRWTSRRVDSHSGSTRSSSRRRLCFENWILQRSWKQRMTFSTFRVIWLTYYFSDIF